MATLCRRLSQLLADKGGRVRHLHLYLCGSASPGTLLPLNLPPSDIAHVTVGVGGVALYNQGQSSNVWFHSSPTQASVQWDCLKLPPDESVTLVSIGRTHLTVLTDSRTVYTAGGNHFGQCGNHDNNGDELELAPVHGLAEPVKQVVCGLDHTLFLTSAGRVCACGWSADGQTGVGHYGNVYEPTPLDVDNAVSIYTCGDSSFALTESGQVYGWGNNEYGQLGVVTKDQQVCSPVPIDLSDLDSKVVAIATGGAFTGVLTAAGSVYVAGYTIESPEQCTLEGETIIDRSHLSSFRKLADIGRGRSLHAGLNYLVAGLHGNLDVSHELLVWGRSPGDVANRAHTRRMQVDKSVIQLSFGATEVAALLATEDLDLLANANPFHFTNYH